MFCINCSHSDTRVTNSRPARKRPSIWRRRRCTACDYTFTTWEIVEVDDQLLVSSNDGKERFSLPRLALSLAPHLPAGAGRGDTAWQLAQTTMEHIIRARLRPLTPLDIAAYAYETLRHYEPRAGLTYGLLYNFVDTAKPRRGRPPGR